MADDSVPMTSFTPQYTLTPRMQRQLVAIDRCVGFLEAVDIDRLRRVARYHRATRVALAEWKKGKQPTFFRLKKVSTPNSGRRASWIEITDVDELFA